MAKDGIVKAIEIMLSASPSGMAKMGPRIKKLIDKAKKDKGKPKGRSPSMILGSASKAGMQGKQGTTSLSIQRKPFQRAPNPGIPGKGPLPLSPANKKTNGKEGSMVESFRKNKKKGKRG
tara:strand:+ start:265 stop:624 length:360 start_codon:yes stop_codon:yes gene_type:complete